MNYHQKYSFSAINIKKKVATRFRSFSKQVSYSHTETLEAMMNFFEWNELTPNDNLGVQNNSIKKRINASIAILKNIENSQTKPTNAMLELLFQQNDENEQEEDDFFEFESQELISENEELIYYRNQYDIIKTNYYLLKNEFETLLQSTKYVRNNFGASHYKLNITKEEFESIKQKLKNVYHHNTTKINE